MRYCPVVLIPLLLTVALVPTARAGDCYRNRGTCYASYGYYQPTYYQAPYYPQYAVKVVEVPTTPSYYYDSGSGYRDSLLADAIAFRVMSAQLLVQRGVVPTSGGQGGAPHQDAAPSRAAAPPPLKQSAPTKVDPKFQQLVTETCLKCHNGPSNRGAPDLSDLATVPAGTRWAAHGLCSSGEMPKGGKPITDEQLKLVYDWARGTSPVAEK